jgi:outer membrane lipoprotein-sorting protein
MTRSSVEAPDERLNENSLALRLPCLIDLSESAATRSEEELAKGLAVNRLRTLSTRGLVLVLAVAVLVMSATGTAIALAASGSGGPTPPAKPLDQTIHDALAAPRPAGITARIRFTNNLFPSGALLGGKASALMTGATGRLWVTSDGRARLELQSDAGDVQIVLDPPCVTVYDASSNTVYRATLPSDTSRSSGAPGTGAPTLAQIDEFLAGLGAHATISGAEPTNVAARPAYGVMLSPKRDGGLLASAELAWDASAGVPLRAAILGKGSSAPALGLEVTDISYGPVAADTVAISPPANATVVDLGTIGMHGTAGDTTAPVTGITAVEAAAGFPVTAPDTLLGLPRREVHLVGGADSRAVLVVYGEGLGATYVVERPAGDGSAGGSALASLPTVPLDGVTAHELSTQLGTILTWRRAGVAYVLAGSQPTTAVEAAARALG